MTGTPVPRKRVSARSIVPSPPSTIATSGAPSSSSSTTISTPLSAATRRTRSRAAATSVSARPCVMTAAVLTDGIGDPAFELGGDDGLLSVDEVEDELTVSLRSGKGGVYDAPRLASGLRERLGYLADDAPLHGGIAND